MTTTTLIRTGGTIPSATKPRERMHLLVLLLPGMFGLFVGFVLPLLVMVRMSLNVHGSGGQLIESLSFSSYASAFADGFYWKVIGNTLLLGLGCGFAAVILSYPVALFLVRTTSRWKGVLIALAIAPLLTSAVARTYGWMSILGDRGIINETLLRTGMLQAPARLSNNMLGTTIALVEILMPYAILAMISGFGRLDASLEEAAGSLGVVPLEVVNVRDKVKTSGKMGFRTTHIYNRRSSCPTLTHP